VVPMPVGQIVGRMNEVRPVADVMAALVREAEETVGKLPRASASSNARPASPLGQPHPSASTAPIRRS
jgi:hypothetical protein